MLLKATRKGITTLLHEPVKKWMTDYVITIPPDKSAVEIASIMVGEDVSALVVEKEGKPIGIVTERDFITKVPLNEKVFKMNATDIMSSGKPPVQSVTPLQPLRDVAAKMKENKIRKLVVAHDGHAIGMITQTDLSRAIYEAIKVVVTNKVPTVKDVMSDKIHTVKKSLSFKKAKEEMKKYNVSALPVVEKGYVGIFTEYDVVLQFYDSGGKLQARSLSKIMKAPIKAIPSHLSIFDANTIMLFEKIRRLLVMEKNEVVGIITQTDLVRACFEYAENTLKYTNEYAHSITKEQLTRTRLKTSIISTYGMENIRLLTMR